MGCNPVSLKRVDERLSPRYALTIRIASRERWRLDFNVFSVNSAARFVPGSGVHLFPLTISALASEEMVFGNGHGAFDMSRPVAIDACQNIHDR
jgi:hypothetical protein